MVQYVPLQFLKAVLPDPRGAKTTKAKHLSVAVSVVSKTVKNVHTMYTTTVRARLLQETSMQGVSYTTGVPAMIGAMMFLKGLWKRPGVWNVEEFNPDPFMEALNQYGLLRSIRRRFEDVIVFVFLNLYKQSIMQVGDKAPEVLGLNEKGEEIRTSDYKGTISMPL